MQSGGTLLGYSFAVQFVSAEPANSYKSVIKCPLCAKGGLMRRSEKGSDVPARELEQRVYVG
jgi:hypothetical protein